jgi:hypothetical protein
MDLKPFHYFRRPGATGNDSSSPSTKGTTSTGIFDFLRTDLTVTPKEGQREHNRGLKRRNAIIR